MNFTKQSLNSIQANGKQQSFKDNKSRNLVLLITAKGTKTFYIIRKINNKTERIKIGRFPDVTIEQARRECAKLNQQIELGINPNEAKRKKQNEPVLNDLFNLYLENHIKLHNKSEKEAVYNYNRYLKPLHKKQLSKITKLTVLELQRNLVNSISERTANKATSLLKAIFNRAIDWDIWDNKNPVQGVQKFKQKSRERYLLEQEELPFFSALNTFNNPILRAFFYMLFYTGARKGELLSMKWDDIYYENGINYWKATQSKTGNTKTTPLIKEATTLLNELKTYAINDFVFFSETSKSGYLQAPQKAWYRLCKVAEIENFRIHDIRHTGATWLSSQGAGFSIIRDYLGHSNTSVTGIYTNQNIKAQLETVQGIFDKLNNRLDFIIKDKK
jgi:integrase